MPWGSRGGVPCLGGYPGWGGTLAGGVSWPGGTLSGPAGGSTLPGPAGGGGYPGWGGTLPGPARGVPWLGGFPGRGGTLAGWVSWLGEYPGQGGTQLGQHREYLLHGGRYASCVHAGGLSCIVHVNDIFVWEILSLFSKILHFSLTRINRR